MLIHDPMPAIVGSLLKGDASRARALKAPVAAMRREYMKTVPCVDYRNSGCASAYMVAYFPYYVAPAHRILESLPSSITEPIFRQTSVEVCALGCGPAPEVLGLASYVSEHFSGVERLNASLHDVNIHNWEPYIDLSLSQLLKSYWPNRLTANMVDCSLLRDCSNCASATCRVFSRTADVYILQNCLNDVGAHPDVVGAKLMKIMRSAKPGALFVIINAVSGIAARVMRSLEAGAAASGVGIVSRSVIGSSICVPVGFDLPPILKSHLFTGGNGLIAKRHVRFISSVIVRSREP